MGSAAQELDDLRRAADAALSQAISDLVAAAADAAGTADRPPSGSPSLQLVVVGPGVPGEFKATGPVSFASFGPNFAAVPAMPAMVEAKPVDSELPTPLMVARYLASRHIVAHPEHAELWEAARWITTSRGEATALGEMLRAADTKVALILVADGAACHGAKAPRAQDARAEAYDGAVCDALASGQPARLAQLDADLGHELGATGPDVWPVLLAAAGTDVIGTADPSQPAVWVGNVLWNGAPYGVGWTVASWQHASAESEGPPV